jgi:HAD superfamily hydrolase (TIGR01549 family)
VKYSAILFDLDGTLVDSIDLYGEAVIRAMKEININVSKHLFRKWYTRAMHFRDWISQYGLTEEDCPQVRSDRDKMYIELLRKKVRFCLGAKEVLKYFHGKVPLALVTGSWMSYVNASDERLHFKSFFQTIVTVDAIGKLTKPHPHGLFLAADRLKVDPKKCLYVGDQLFDVEASKAAGMPCCIVRGPYTTEETMEKADFTVETLEELKTVAKQ